MPAEHAIRGAFGITAAVREPEPMDEFLREAFNCEPFCPPQKGANHQYEIQGSGHGADALWSWSRNRTWPRARGRFGEGTIHHHAFDVGSPENQLVVQGLLVGLGYTDVSDVKDRGYFFSVYLRTPGGALFELAYSRPRRASRSTSRWTSWARTCASRRTGRTGAARSLLAGADRHHRRGRRLNPHLAAPPVVVGRAIARARRVAVVVHGRGQDPVYMLEHLVVPSSTLPDVAYVLPPAAGGSWYPGALQRASRSQRAVARPRARGRRECDRRPARGRCARGAARARRVLAGRLPRRRPRSLARRGPTRGWRC